MLMKFSKSQNKGDIEKLPTFFLPNWQKLVKKHNDLPIFLKSKIGKIRKFLPIFCQLPISWQYKIWQIGKNIT